MSRTGSLPLPVQQGAGKQPILDAITLALFGQTVRLGQNHEEQQRDHEPGDGRMHGRDRLYLFERDIPVHLVSAQGKEKT